MVKMTNTKIKFEIIESKEKQFIKKSYADNFTK